MSKVTLLSKVYDAESICTASDVVRDVNGCWDSSDKLPEPDESGFVSGTFRVEVIWCSEDDCDCTGFHHRPTCPQRLGKRWRGSKYF